MMDQNLKWMANPVLVFKHLGTVLPEGIAVQPDGHMVSYLKDAPSCLRHPKVVCPSASAESESEVASLETCGTIFR